MSDGRAYFVESELPGDISHMPKACSLPSNLAGGIDFVPLAPFLVEAESINTTVLAQKARAHVNRKE